MRMTETTWVMFARSRAGWLRRERRLFVCVSIIRDVEGEMRQGWGGRTLLRRDCGLEFGS